MRSKAVWFIVLATIGGAIAIFLVSQRRADREDTEQIPVVEVDDLDIQFEPPAADDDPPDANDYEVSTTVRRPLQQKLATAFPGCYKSGVDVIWGPLDGWISPEVFDWWIPRLEEGDIEKVTQDAAERMFSWLAGDASVFSEPDGRRLCAVVGASRNLLGSGYGDLIDAHDLIFRINRAPTDSYQGDVGEKTTHHVMWPRDLEEWQYDSDAYLLMTPVTASTRDVFGRIQYLVLEDLHWDPMRVRIIQPGFVMHLHENWTEGWMAYPSTGFITLMIALNVCDEVDVFGFGADAAGRWDRYYEDFPEDVSQFHPASIEAELMREMEEREILRIYRGSRFGSDSETDPSTRR